jgi:hypothetical protein
MRAAFWAVRSRNKVPPRGHQVNTTVAERTKVFDEDKKIISELLIVLKHHSGGLWTGEEWDLIKRARKATRRTKVLAQ